MRPKVICLTPVRNEGWILEKFLACASLWADHIIVADQHSEDRSVEIALGFEKVTLIRNPELGFNEPERQKMLIDAARRIPGPRLLVALDADEFLTPNFFDGPEWTRALSAPPGTAILAKRENIRPDFRYYWTDAEILIGYVDDGLEHAGLPIHSCRLPFSSEAPKMAMDEIRLLHYQYTDWDRMSSKHRWYLCWERINNPRRSPVGLYRQYHHMYGLGDGSLKEAPGWWFEGYAKHGIDMRNTPREGNYWWDREVLRLFEEHGAEKFKRDAVWSTDWVMKARTLNVDNPDRFIDPRSIFDKAVQLWLAKTQANNARVWVRFVDKCLSALWRLRLAMYGSAR